MLLRVTLRGGGDHGGVSGGGDHRLRSTAGFVETAAGTDTTENEDQSDHHEASNPQHHGENGLVPIVTVILFIV